MTPQEEGTKPIDEYIMEQIKWRVRSGFFTFDAVLRSALNMMEAEEGTAAEQTKRRVLPLIAREWEAQMEKQKEWPPGSLLIDKLQRAFDSLERNHKILGRMNFSCCQTCGIAEIGEDSDDDTAGYVFFHEQETESIVGGASRLHLAFGSFTKSKKKSVEVGRTIAGSLRRAGLSVDWNESAGRKIAVECPEWRNRVEEEDIEDLLDDDYGGASSDDDTSSESDPEPDTESDLVIEGDDDGDSSQEQPSQGGRLAA